MAPVRTATWVLPALLLTLLSASPTAAYCPYQLPMVEGGGAGRPAGFILTRGADHVNGFFWELGFGNPADGVGNDSNSLIAGYPAFTQPDPDLRWIKNADTDMWVVDYNWFNAGVDGCLSGGSGSIASTVAVFYILDSDDQYAVAALQGTTLPLPLFDLDLLVTGIGIHGNGLALIERALPPDLGHSDLVDEFCTMTTVHPAVAGLNTYYDAGGPYDGIFDVSGLTLTTGGVPLDCDPLTGCALDCVTNNANLCWEGEVPVIGSVEEQTTSICVGGLLNGYACDPTAGMSDPCVQFSGTCPAPPPLLHTMGPPIPGGCIFVGGFLVDDSAVAWATKSRGFTVFRWEATQYAVSHFNIYDVTRGERRVNAEAIPRQGENDGALTTYEFVATGAELRGGKRFQLELVRTDGQAVRFDIED